MNSIGAGAVGGSNGCAASGGAVGGAEAMQQYGASAGAAGLSGLLNPGMLLLLAVSMWSNKYCMAIIVSQQFHFCVATLGKLCA